MCELFRVDESTRETLRSTMVRLPLLVLATVYLATPAGAVNRKKEECSKCNTREDPRECYKQCYEDQKDLTADAEDKCKKFCEESGFGESACKSQGCCDWQGDKCWYDSSGTCEPVEEQACPKCEDRACYKRCFEKQKALTAAVEARCGPTLSDANIRAAVKLWANETTRGQAKIKYGPIE